MSGHDIGCRFLISARFVDVTTTRSDILANLYVFTVRTGSVGCNMRENNGGNNDTTTLPPSHRTPP
jgi:hypothetical protein